MFKKGLHEDYLRSIVFGFQDALVSTTGVIAGVAIGTSDREIIILAGVVTIAVEALSMGAGQYLSEKSVHQMDKTGRHTDNLILVGILMFLSYFLGGLVPLAPVLTMPIALAPTFTVIFALAGLLVLGFIKAKLVKVDPFKSAIEMFLIGGTATAIGLIVGHLFKV